MRYFVTGIMPESKEEVRVAEFTDLHDALWFINHKRQEQFIKHIEMQEKRGCSVHDIDYGDAAIWAESCWKIEIV